MRSCDHRAVPQFNTAELSDAVEDRIEKLINDSDQIETLFENLMRGIGLKTTDVIGAGPWWAGPTDELSETQREAQQKYELWYNSARPLISEYATGRIGQFDECYEEFKSWLELDDEHARQDSAKAISLELNSFDTQRNTLRAIPNSVESEQLRATKRISERITGDELQYSRDLYEGDHLRAAGVVAGVALERHLMTMCETSGQDLDFGFMDGISALAQTLNEGDLISDDDMRLLDHLSGIRNKCAHPNDDDLSSGEVDRLISEANEFLRKHSINSM